MTAAKLEVKPITEYNAIKLAKELMAKHGLGKYWFFRLNTNKRRKGVCKYAQNHLGGTIEISKYHLPNGEASVKNTILHEIAHALVGPGHKHNHVWRSKALSIGCDGRTCSMESNEVEPNYIGKCPAGHEYKAFRLRRGRKSCTTCNPYGGFNEKYLITWESTK